MIGFRPEEFAEALKRKNRLALSAAEEGIVLAGGDFFDDRREERPESDR